MPIYEFKCLKCGKPAEVLQRVGDRAPACPSCGSKRMTRSVSRTSFQLKGGGWYADLYATPRPGAAKVEGGPGTAEKSAGQPEAGGKPESGAKPETGAKAEAAAKPATPPAAPPGPKPETGSREAGRPARGRSPSPRRKR
jgi:putative FmdB family regulatory protein